jgi:type VI secretion system protein
MLSSGVAVALAALLPLSTACSLGKKVRSAFGGRVPFEVTIAAQANNDSPVAVDFLAVYDQKVLDELQKMRAAEWFTRKQRYASDHSNNLGVMGWEWVPGQAVAPLELEYRPGLRQIVLFADYHTEGDHRALIHPQRPFHLILGDRGFTVEVKQ